MKKKLLSIIPVIILFGCSQQENATQISTHDLSASNDGGKRLPYFAFDKNGEVSWPDSSVHSLKKASAGGLILNDSAAWDSLQNEMAARIETDTSFVKSIFRPLDYVCPLTLLAIFNESNTVSLADGSIMLDQASLRAQCEYIGTPCTENCGDSLNDPYTEIKSLKKATMTDNSYGTSVTVEIYPYRLYATSFITNVKLIYSAAGAESQFKKRDRVWTGPFDGMQWRWVDWDPSLSSVRTYCIACESDGTACGYDPKGGVSSDLTTNGWFSMPDYVSERCSWQFAIKGFKATTNWNPTPNEPYNPSVFETQCANPGSACAEAKGGPVKGQKLYFGLVKNYKGGEVGMHYVKQGDNEFYARTSKNVPASVLSALNQNFSYRK